MEFKGMEWVRIGSVHFVKCRVVVGNVVSGGGETRAGRCIFSFLSCCGGGSGGGECFCEWQGTHSG